jgi:transposase InsO family protein
MPWMTKNLVEQRYEFVILARAPGACVAELCRRFGLSRQCGYKWLRRFAAGGKAALADRSRRPRRSPEQLCAKRERALVALRKKHPAWGARKLLCRLAALGESELPAPSTAHRVLVRHGLVGAAPGAGCRPWQRFERAEPNALWQMDFKGHFALGTGARCHPLTVLDDHSRYCLGLVACAGESDALVRPQLAALFARHGLPAQILCDYGPPWGNGAAPERWTALGVWLLRLGIGLIHGRPRHPQTQGKDERFHRTLLAEVISRRDLRDPLHAQRAFDRWRSIYNTERPHQALGMATPASRYAPSPRPWPAQLPPITYAPEATVRTVRALGLLTWRGRTYGLGRAFAGLPVGLRPTATDGLFTVAFCHHLLGTIDLRTPAQPKHQLQSLLPLPDTFA